MTQVGYRVDCVHVNVNNVSYVICVLLRRIPHLGSEIQFIDDMVDSHVHVGEQGHMFTTLKVTQYYEIPQ